MSNTGSMGGGTPTTPGATAGTPAPVPDEATATDKAKEKAQEVAEQAAQAADAAKSEASSVVESAKGEAGAVVEEAKSQAQSLVREGRSQLKQQVDDQTSRVADTLGQISSQLQSMAGSADDPSSPAANVVRQAGDQVDRFARRLQEQGLDGVTSDLRRYASNRPGLFLAGCFAAGFVGARLARTVDLGEVAKGTSGDDTNGAGTQFTGPSTGQPLTAGTPAPPPRDVQPTVPTGPGPVEAGRMS